MRDQDNLLFNPFERQLREIKGRLDLSDIEATPKVFGYRDPCKEVNANEIPDRICVVGGGIAGLTAAYELARLANKMSRPTKIDVLERSERFGGRILTHYFDDQNYAEFGPMRIPYYHELVRHYIGEFGLDTHEFVGDRHFYLSTVAPSNPKPLDNLIGEREAAESLLNKYPGSVREFFEQLLRENVRSDSIGIGAFEDNFVKAIDGLRHRKLWNIPYARYGRRKTRFDRFRWELFHNRPETVWGRVVEGLSVRESFELYFREAEDTFRFGGGDLNNLSPDQLGQLADCIWEDVGRTNGLVWLEHISMAHFLREVTALSSELKIAVEGGFQRLAHAFVASLQASPHVTLNTRCIVERIKLNRSTVEVTSRWPAGEQVTREYERVISAVPAAATLQIDFMPELPPDKRNALASISYLSASKSAAYFERRFWEADLRPRKIGGVTYTDLPNQQIWYPNDNALPPSSAEPADDEPDVVDDTFEDGPPATSVFERAYVPRTRELKDRERSEGRGVLLAAYMWGQNAKRFSALSKSQQDEVVRSCLERVHPGCSQYLIDLKHWPWDNQSNPGGGGFAWYRPGQQSRYQEPGTKPHRQATRGPNLVCFAGEHLGLLQGWIQGAMQTALSAVLQACGR